MVGRVVAPQAESGAPHSGAARPTCSRVPWAGGGGTRGGGGGRPLPPPMRAAAGTPLPPPERKRW
jgi:hypothetical protein